MAKIDELFKIMVNNEASDLHLTSGAPPALRIHGDIQPLNYRPLTHEECKALLYEIISPHQREAFEENWELDCSYNLEGVGRFRVNMFQQRKGIGAVFRYIPSKLLTLDQLKLPAAIRNILKSKKGLVLVTGPTGSGKSTTLAAMIDHLNKEHHYHILTIEDPIEFVHENQGSIVNQREVGGNTKSFKNALKAALREDPDVILVGEMRDLETISLAMTAAETGHIVFGTLHTMSAPKTIDRIIDSFPDEQQAQVRVMLSESLNAVISQVLLRKQGSKGRVAALEIMINSSAIKNLIREGKTFQIASTMQTSASYGMQTMDAAVRELMVNEIISKDAAEPYLQSKKIKIPGANDDDDGPAPTGGPVSPATGKRFQMPTFGKKTG